MILLSRRAALAGALILPLTPTLVPAIAQAASRDITFAVYRNGTKIGQHHIAISGPDGEETAVSNVDMKVKIGPITAYHYQHEATERWAGGAFKSLDSRTNGNGKKQAVTARRGAGGVSIDCAKGHIAAPAACAPFTHWNTKVFGGPLFNPQEGKLLKVTATKVTPRHWQIRGDAQIDDFYDEAGAWTSLKGKLEDGSTLEYKRA